MFQIIVPTVTRKAIPHLLAVLAVAVAGCAGMQMGNDSELSRAVTGGYRSGEIVAVLLPESGRYAGAAQVVRDGIVAAYEADPQHMRPTLRYYDSTAGSVVASVQKAAADGAGLVIGPLQKPAVDELAGAPALPIPVLALNETSDSRNPPKNLFQFALSPEDEATQVADKAWDKGHRTALMLYPEGNWGNRISRAFRQQWKALGGAMAASQAFDSSAVDFSGPVTQLSKHAAGADFVFLVATSKLARQISPQIRHKIGAEVPIYSTSHIYSGRFDPKGDRNLVGLNFVEIPWLVEAARGDAVSSKGLYKKLPRLYAMGVDAYRLGSRLNWMSQSPRPRVQGKTGLLVMDSQRRIHRELALARIDATGPVKTAAIDALELGTLVWTERQVRIGPRIAAVGSPALGVSHP
ncbi:MAG: penicillin-binding protein activator [Chromatiaceae bacterium]|nr:penicillin-binding protein activator [Chromatiaceae bacterium]